MVRKFSLYCLFLNSLDVVCKVGGRLCCGNRIYNIYIGENLGLLGKRFGYVMVSFYISFREWCFRVIISCVYIILKYEE